MAHRTLPGEYAGLDFPLSGVARRRSRFSVENLNQPLHSFSDSVCRGRSGEQCRVASETATIIWEMNYHGFELCCKDCSRPTAE